MLLGGPKGRERLVTPTGEVSTDLCYFLFQKVGIHQGLTYIECDTPLCNTGRKIIS